MGPCATRASTGDVPHLLARPFMMVLELDEFTLGWCAGQPLCSIVQHTRQVLVVPCAGGMLYLQVLNVELYSQWQECPIAGQVSCDACNPQVPF